MKSTAVAPLAVALFLALPSHAQRVLRKSAPQPGFPGSGPYQHGLSVARAGDVDGDGLEDWWMGAGNTYDTDGGEGYVSLCSGADGQLLRVLEGFFAGQNFGLALAGGADLSGDGVPDVLVGSPAAALATSEAGAVRAYSGADGSLLYTVPGALALAGFGRALVLLDDIDLDGVQDFCVGAPLADLGGTERGAVCACSGATGAFLRITVGAEDGAHAGHALASAGDVDGDGCADLLIGAPGGGPLGEGVVRLRSGRTGALLRSLHGTAPGDAFGFALGGSEDLSGDGTPDLLVGVQGTGSIQVHSGADGSLLWSATRTRFGPSFPPPEQASFGWSVCGIGDQDGDGLGDVAVGYPENDSVWFFSGADGAELGLCASTFVHPVGAEPLTNLLGWSLARLGDLDGDGRDEVVAGAPLDDAVNAYPVVNALGSAAVLSARVPRTRLLLANAPGTGQAVASAGDLDGDGAAELAYTSVSGIQILSGSDRTPLRTYPASAGPQGLDCAGDVDGDGVDDLIVAGSPPRIYSGASGLEIPGFGAESGAAVAGLGDLDGDGHADVAVGTSLGHFSDIGSLPCFGEGLPAGHVRVLSGATGALLFQVDGMTWDVFGCSQPVSESFGFCVSSAGDWNRDGTPDLAVGAPAAGSIRGGAARVFSGLDGSLLANFDGPGGYSEFGIAVSGAPGFDVNVDGYPDLVVGEQTIGYGPGGSDGGAYVFSGFDGSLLGGAFDSVSLGYGRETGPGYSVLALGDFDLDGTSDFAMANPAWRSLLGPGAGRVVIVSGRTHAVLESVTGTSSWDYLGYSLAAIGNADGSADLLVGAPAGGVPSAFTNLPTSSGGAFLVRHRTPPARHGAPDGTFQRPR